MVSLGEILIKQIHFLSCLFENVLHFYQKQGTAYSLLLFF